MLTLHRSDRRARPLTAGEIAIARLVFRDAIDYSTVRVHARPYLPFGLQPPHTAMAPNGHLYFPPACHQNDFAACGISDQMWFIHEMTHVWQFQLGYWVRTRGAIRIGLDYGYTLAAGKRLSDYNMEAQGNVLADYFALRFRGSPARLYEGRYRHAPDALALYEAVLAEFIAAPSDRRHLPKRRAARLSPDGSR
ncbi:Rhs element Vgr protein [Caballeronia sp. LZ019]|uniref:Rhs element Vgr protein n=1 Tax=Caballeronia sp. LZ019 TaxID=3038555 RepID=UPI0028594194|nr:Rhs element Vgr protein [Caballeronia sp. LZ019]MDR5811285.1 Rhs element Vgr protein [Caballeronia sp. LZ019]